MDDIQGMLDRLPELSDADLDTLEGKIIQRFESVEAEEITRETVNEMTYLADSIETVRSEIGRRANEVAKLTAKASEAATRLSGGEMSAGAEASDEEVDSADEGGEETVLTAPPADEEEVPEEAPSADEAEDTDEEVPPKKRPPLTFAAESEPAPEETTLAVEEPEVPAVEAAELSTTEPETLEPEAAELAVEEPETVTPEAAELSTQEPAAPAVELAVEEPKVVEPEAVELSTTEPDVPAVEAIELATEEPETATPEAAALSTTEAEIPAVEAIELATEEPQVPAEVAELATEAVETAIEAVELAVEAVEAAVEEAAELATDEAANTPETTVEAVEEVVAEDHPNLYANSGEETQTSTEAQMDTTPAGTFAAPADRQPVPRPDAIPAPIAVIAGGDIPGITAGSPLADVRALADAFSTRLHSLRRVSGNSGEQVVVASLLATFPEDRTLRTNEVDSNSEKIKNVTSPFTIVASGGWCAPLPVNYDIFDIGGSTNTPVRDALPVFNADRGGVRYIVPPTIADYDGAVAIWTNQDDIDAATDPDKKKVCLTVQCAGEQSVYLDAVTMCMCFGNLQTRAFPELIAKHNELALVHAARFAETHILNQIKANSTPVGPIGPVLGSARDVLISVERAAVAYRYAHRLDPNLPLRFVAPQWLHAMVRSDITAQLPGDGMDTTFALADDAINRFFTARNINPVWSLEGSSAGEVPSYTDYPDTVEWALFAEGTFTLLDGGTLDIGIVRDMELVAKNDYCMFTEQFLAVAKTGVEGIWVTENFNVNGGSAGTLDVAAVDF